MSGTRTVTASTDDVAAAVRDATFVRILARTDGDAIAAAGLLATACRSTGVPFQVRVTRPLEETGGDADAGVHDDQQTILVGVAAEPDDAGNAGESGGPDVALTGEADTAVSVAAFETAQSLGANPDPVLALAGAVSRGTVPGADGTEPMLALARERGRIERRPGIAIPTADLADGLAHTTLAAGPFSGDHDAATAALTDRDLPTHRTDGGGSPDDSGESDGTVAIDRAVASFFAISVATAEGAVPRAADRVERALRPYAIRDGGEGNASFASGSFATVGGYADVLDAVAREDPGTGVALALGHDAAHDAALSAWRDHARAVHRQLRAATTERYDGLFVARVETDDLGRLRTIARLVCDFRSPEPVALVVGETGAAAASVEPQDLGAVVERAVDAVDGAGRGDPRRAQARFDADASAFVTAFREVLCP